MIIIRISNKNSIHSRKRKQGKNSKNSQKNTRSHSHIITNV